MKTSSEGTRLSSLDSNIWSLWPSAWKCQKELPTWAPWSWGHCRECRTWYSHTCARLFGKDHATAWWRAATNYNRSQAQSDDICTALLPAYMCKAFREKCRTVKLAAHKHKAHTMIQIQLDIDQACIKVETKLVKLESGYNNLTRIWVYSLYCWSAVL